MYDDAPEPGLLFDPESGLWYAPDRPTLIQRRGRWAWAEELLEGRGPVYRAFAGVVVGLAVLLFVRIVLGLLQARAEGRL